MWEHHENRTQVQLTDQQTEALKRLAQQRGVSVAELVREGVDLLLQTAGSPISREERIRRALAASGRFHSDVGDLSIRHDDYFAESVES
jgi:Arc/MetJ-type ribon-helix-helix transcriptional regulator